MKRFFAIVLLCLGFLSVLAAIDIIWKPSSIIKIMAMQNKNKAMQKQFEQAYKNLCDFELIQQDGTGTAYVRVELKNKKMVAGNKESTKIITNNIYHLVGLIYQTNYIGITYVLDLEKQITAGFNLQLIPNGRWADVSSSAVVFHNFYELNVLNNRRSKETDNGQWRQ